MEKDARYLRAYRDGYNVCLDKAKKAYCKVNCPHFVEYCWQDEEDQPCKEFASFINTMIKL